MKLLKLSFLSITLFLMHNTVLQAQTVSYGYDAAGNRISRVIYLSPLRSAPAVEEETSLTSFNEMLSDFKILIYPNPTKGKLSVEITPFPENPQGEIGIWTAQGKALVQQKISSDRAEFDLSNEPSGIYFLKISLNKQETVWKIIKND